MCKVTNPIFLNPAFSAAAVGQGPVDVLRGADTYVNRESLWTFSDLFFSKAGSSLTSLFGRLGSILGEKKVAPNDGPERSALPDGIRELIQLGDTYRLVRELFLRSSSISTDVISNEVNSKFKFSGRFEEAVKLHIDALARVRDLLLPWQKMDPREAFQKILGRQAKGEIKTVTFPWHLSFIVEGKDFEQLEASYSTDPFFSFETVGMTFGDLDERLVVKELGGLVSECTLNKGEEVAATTARHEAHHSYLFQLPYGVDNGSSGRLMTALEFMGSLNKAIDGQKKEILHSSMIQISELMAFEEMLCWCSSEKIDGGGVMDGLETTDNPVERYSNIVMEMYLLEKINNKERDDELFGGICEILKERYHERINAIRSALRTLPHELVEHLLWTTSYENIPDRLGKLLK